MSIKFSKWHANGNDFLITECLSQDFSLNKKSISQIANRHQGIGFDQLILVCPPINPKSDFSFRFFNADGTEAGNCLNGSRCAVSFIKQQHFSKKDSLVVDIKNSSNSYSISRGSVATESTMATSLNIPRALDKHLLRFKLKKVGFVEIGNKHLILSSKSKPKSIDLISLDKVIRSIADFNDANISVFHKDKNVVSVRTSENGVGETLSCGSAAAAIASLLNEKNLVVASPGGKLKTLKTKKDTIILKGPTEHIMECTWERKKK